MAKQQSNKVFINQYDIVEFVVNGDQTPESVTQMADEAEALVKKQRAEGKPALLLDNLLQMGKVPQPARRKVVERAKSLDYDKFAFVSNDTLIRFGSNLIMQAIGRGNTVRHFDSYDEAIKWLQAK